MILEDWKKDYPEWIVAPKAKLVNREQKRSYRKKASKIANELDYVESNFLGCIFDESLNIDYKTLYTKHLEVFQKTIKELKKHLDTRKININELYFEKKYKPMEPLSHLF